MKQIRVLAQYYVDLMVKLGLVRFSLLLASALVVLAMVVQMAVTMLLRGEVESIDVVRSIFFGLLITPWAVYFLGGGGTAGRVAPTAGAAGGQAGRDAPPRSGA